LGKIKLFKASSFYDQYLNYFFTNNFKWKDQSYNELKASMFYDSFGLSDCIKSSLECTGGYDVYDSIVNSEALQLKWAKENNLKLPNNKIQILKEVLQAQILEFQPDILFAHDNALIDAIFLKRIKSLCPSIRLVMAYDGVAFCDKDKFKEVDLMLTCVSYIKDYYLRNGLRSEVFHYGFNKDVLGRLTSSKKNLYNVSFVGGLNLMSGGHHKRLKVLSKLSGISPSYFISSSCLEGHELFRWPQRKRILSGRIREAIQISKVGKRNQGVCYGLEMFQALHDSKIALNVHIDNAKNSAANIRLFEATGVGACLLTDWKENIQDFFEPDYEIVTFKSVDECLDKAKYLLENETERDKIAAAGQKKTLENFTLQKRCDDLDLIIRKHLI
tara:strand:+ start:4729 stop:5889 length:1161 start_codon:yes stop_codon:yes gene_type:complete